MSPEDARAEAERAWADIEKFASYSFNRSHAVSYALIAYRCQQAKALFPARFYAPFLNIHRQDKEKYPDRNGKKQPKLPRFLKDAKQLGVRFLPADIWKSGVEYVAEDDYTVREGLQSIIKPAGAAEWVKKRNLELGLEGSLALCSGKLQKPCREKLRGL
jgi:DNA polymerase-3 subunit alpha